MPFLNNYSNHWSHSLLSTNQNQSATMFFIWYEFSSNSALYYSVHFLVLWDYASHCGPVIIPNWPKLASLAQKTYTLYTFISLLYAFVLLNIFIWNIKSPIFWTEQSKKDGKDQESSQTDQHLWEGHSFFSLVTFNIPDKLKRLQYLLKLMTSLILSYNVVWLI